MPTNAAMIAANASRWSKAHIHAEWQKTIDATADRLTMPANKARFQAVEKNEAPFWRVEHRLHEAVAIGSILGKGGDEIGAPVVVSGQ